MQDRILNIIESLTARVARLERIRAGEQLGNRIRQLLDEKEMTVEDLAAAIAAQPGPDLAASTLQQIIGGDIETPTEPAVAAIAQALDVSQDSLFALIPGGRDASGDEGRF